MFLAAGGILGQGLRQCTTGLVIEATRHSVLFIDPQGEAFPLIGENTWAACRSRQKTFLVWMSSLASYYFTNPMS